MPRAVVAAHAGADGARPADARPAGGGGRRGGTVSRRAARDRPRLLGDRAARVAARSRRSRRLHASRGAPIETSQASLQGEAMTAAPVAAADPIAALDAGREMGLVRTRVARWLDDVDEEL